MIPCYRPVTNVSDLAAGSWPFGGKREFEAAFAAHVGAGHGLAFAYARLGCFITLKALGLEGAEIILPAFTCANMAEAVVASGNRPVFVDINPDDYVMDLEALSKALTPRTRAVIATHMFGFYCDAERVRQIIGDERITVIEDCAQRVPGRSASTPGFSGDIALHSLGRSKPLCTITGGFVATHSTELHERMKTIRDRDFNHLSIRSQAGLWLWWLASYVVYQRTFYGYWQRKRGSSSVETEASAKLTEAVYQTQDAGFAGFQGRIGLNQLKRVDAMLARRRTLAQLYDRELQAVPTITRPPLLPDATQTYYTIRVPRRDEIQFEQRMRAEGVMVGRTYNYVVPELKPFRQFADRSFPHAQQAASEVVNLPVHSWMREQDVLRVVAAVKRLLPEDLQRSR